MADCPRPLKQCTATVITEASQAECREWACCLPWGASLEFKDGCLTYTPGNPPEDGEYGSVTVVDGCIVAASPLEASVYRGDPCASVPCPCDSESSGDSNLCNPSSTSGNLYSCDMTGRPLVKAYIQSGSENVTVTGSGTSTNPFIISVDVDSALTRIGTNTASVIKITNSGSVAYVDHAEGYNDQIINGMTFDSYGHLQSYEAQDATGVTGVVATSGIDATRDNSSGVVTLSLSDPVNKAEGTYSWGGYDVTLDSKNNIYNVGRKIELTSDTVLWGSNTVTFNEYGSLTAVASEGTTGTYLFTILEVPNEDVLQRTINFNLMHTTRLMVEITGIALMSWAEAMTVRLDNGTLGDACVLGNAPEKTTDPDGNTTTGEEKEGLFIARYVASGLWSAGNHTLKIANRSGFSQDYPMTAAIIPMQEVTSYTDDTSIG